MPASTDTTLYRFFDDAGRLLYVGITGDLQARLGVHRRTQPWWPEVAEITTETVPTRAHARAAEALAIHTEMPLHNVSRPTPASIEEHERRAALRPPAEPQRPEVSEDRAAELQRAAGQVAAWWRLRDEHIVQAVDEGSSLRAVAAMVGMTAQGVADVVRRCRIHHFDPEQHQDAGSPLHLA